MAKYAYTRWANDNLKNLPEAQEQEARKSYFSPEAKVRRYDEYAKWARANGYDFDNSPDGYWEYKLNGPTKPLGYLLGLLGIVAWFSLSLVTGFLGRKAQ